MATWTARRDSRATMPAPNHAPTAAISTMLASRSGSTSTEVMKISACMITPAIVPTISVPGISSSGTRRNSLKIAVVGAKEPMPSVSPNSIKKPTPTTATVGVRTPAARRRLWNHAKAASRPAMTIAPKSPSRVRYMEFRAETCVGRRYSRAAFFIASSAALSRR